mmetsp:Transcript_7327/g.16023  ORF Transcript_7327/g.16023 Transcript_7327/m.16023 type:complete len:368 (-) Transcript_7327:40-1143(-)
MAVVLSPSASSRPYVELPEASDGRLQGMALLGWDSCESCRLPVPAPRLGSAADTAPACHIGPPTGSREALADALARLRPRPADDAEGRCRVSQPVLPAFPEEEPPQSPAASTEATRRHPPDISKEAMLASRTCRARCRGGAAPRLPEPREGRLAVAPEDFGWEERRAEATLGHAALPRVEHLVASLRDRSATVRDAAFEALHSLGPEAKARIAEGLSHRDRDARRVSALALGSLGPGPMEAEALTSALDDNALEVRRAVVEALSCLGPAGPAAAQSAIRSWQKMSHRCPRMYPRQLAAWDGPPPLAKQTRSMGPGGRHLGTCPHPAGRCLCRHAPQLHRPHSPASPVPRRTQRGIIRPREATRTQNF